MTTTTTPSLRDWIIDCAVRWQRRNKLVVPRAGSVPVGASDEVPAVIGPRDAALKALLPAAPAAAVQEIVVPAAPPVEAPMPAAAVAEPIEVASVEPVVAEPIPAGAPDIAPEPVAEPNGLAQPDAAEPTPAAPAVAEPVTEQTKTIPVPHSEPAPAVPIEQKRADLSGMSNWQVLILSGPAGSGKSSIAQQFCEMLPRSVHIKVEPLRDRAYSVLVAQPMAEGGHEAGAKAEVWSGKTEEARQQAADLAGAYIHTGYHVIIDDVIEAPAELKLYQDGLLGLNVQTVTLMPSLEELERRDKMLPREAQAGSRLKEHHANMVRQLSAHSSVLDTSNETVYETVQRILELLKA